MPTKYRWNFTFTWVVEYIRKDAEIMIDLDGEPFQKVITRGCKSREEAERIAQDYCEKLSKLVKDSVKNQISYLKDAKE